MEDVESQHHRLLVGRQRLQLDGRRQIGEGAVGGDEEGNPGAALVGLEFRDHTRGGEHRGGDIEVVAVD